MKSLELAQRCLVPMAVVLLASEPLPGAGITLDAEQALVSSQSAIGNKVANHGFLDADSRHIRMSDLSGKPVLVSLIYTSCHHTCPMITQHLKREVAQARERLGEDAFTVLSVGFDTGNDSPQAMKAFARAQAVSDPDWRFLSADAATIDSLTDELGFHFVRSPRGFDHLVQLSILDRDRKVAAQVYGARFESPRLMEPLKRLAYGKVHETGDFLSGLVTRVRLFCTVYNPNTGRYEFDYSLFLQMAIGGMIILATGFFLLRERRRSRRC